MTGLRISKDGQVVGPLALSVLAADLAARHGVRVELVDRGRVLVEANGETLKRRESDKEHAP